MIYYSHVNEDNRVESSLLRSGSFSSVVAICGSGERVLSLMDNNDCKKLAVVDSNEEAIFLQQLKIAALTKLSVDEYLLFIGHVDSSGDERLLLFELFVNELSLKAQTFWRTNLSLVKRGILHIGHYERFLQRARPVTNFWLGKSFKNIFKPSGQHLNFSAERWKLLQQLFSFKIVYLVFGNRDVAFTGSSSELRRIPAAMDKIIQNGKASSCFMTHLVFKGHLLDMCQEELPPSLQKNVLADIRERLLNREITITYHVEDLLEFLRRKEHETEGPVFYSISDILSFADFDYLHEIVKTTAANENLVVGRSFLRHRLSQDQLDMLDQYGTVSMHDEEESTGMYQVFSLRHKRLHAD
ncbi:DUF3419 family protein [Flavitalea antarctica]